MIRLLLASLVLLCLNAPAHSDTPPGPTADPHATLFHQTRSESALLRSLTPRGSGHPGLVCCKVCSVGKACGNTCISRDKECHVGPGCACDQ
jgi:hypothetical protein